MKNALKHIIIFFRLKTFNSKFLTRVIDFFIINTLKTYLTVKHNNIRLRFYLPNLINYKRILSFSTKEPETLDWIDDFEQNKVFWDIYKSCIVKHNLQANHGLLLSKISTKFLEKNNFLIK